jgi:hypothetical protein
MTVIVVNNSISKLRTVHNMSGASEVNQLVEVVVTDSADSADSADSGNLVRLNNLPYQPVSQDVERPSGRASMRDSIARHDMGVPCFLGLMFVLIYLISLIAFFFLL